MDDMLINNGTLPASDEYSVPSQLSADVQELRRQLSQRDQELHSLQAELDRVRSGLNRRRLPPTRDSLTHKFKVGQHEGYMTVGLYEDGHPGELFLTMAKEGSTVGGLMDTIGILTSLVLQYGVPVDALARKFEYVRFEPSGQTRDAELATLPPSLTTSSAGWECDSATCTGKRKRRTPLCMIRDPTTVSPASLPIPNPSFPSDRSHRRQFAGP